MLEESFFFKWNINQGRYDTASVSAGKFIKSIRQIDAQDHNKTFFNAINNTTHRNSSQDGFKGITISLWDSQWDLL